jgi:hypothetical protein
MFYLFYFLFLSLLQHRPTLLSTSLKEEVKRHLHIVFNPLWSLAPAAATTATTKTERDKKETKRGRKVTQNKNRRWIDDRDSGLRLKRSNRSTVQYRRVSRDDGRPFNE